MDAAALLDIYDEALDEAQTRGISAPQDEKEALTAAAMMLAAMIGIENTEAYSKVAELVASNH